VPIVVCCLLNGMQSILTLVHTHTHSAIGHIQSAVSTEYRCGLRNGTAVLQHVCGTVGGDAGPCVRRISSVVSRDAGKSRTFCAAVRQGWMCLHFAAWSTRWVQWIHGERIERHSCVNWGHKIWFGRQLLD